MAPSPLTTPRESSPTAQSPSAKSSPGTFDNPTLRQSQPTPPPLVSRKSIVSFTEPVHPNDRHRNSVVSLHHVDQSKILEHRRQSPAGSNGPSGCTTPTLLAARAPGPPTAVKSRLETQSLDQILGSLQTSFPATQINVPDIASAITSATPSGAVSPSEKYSLQPIFAPKTDESKIHVLLAASGSVASIKIPLIVNRLRDIYGDKVELQVILTKPAEHFLQGEKMPENVQVWRDKDEWSCWKKSSEKILNAELKKWADVLLIAPLSANTLCKIANGICDNLLTSIIRAWNPAAPIIVAPAMNTHMYTHPFTQKHLDVIKAEMPWIQVLLPVEKKLVCGDVGMGAMMEWSQIVDCLVARLEGPEK